MRKELFFAIGAGLILGLIIAFGIWRVNKTITPSDNNQAQTSEATSTPDAGFLVTIANAEDLDVITENPFNITGLTKLGTKITISAEEKDYILDPEKDGSFEKEISLVAGLNEIVIKAFDLNGDSAETKIKLVYSSEFAKYMQSDEEEKTATDEADSVRLKVEEKLANALKNPKAYIGTITDISKSTYQIKNQNGEIEQLSFSEDTTFVKVDKTTKSITSDDVAIGDSIIAMGFKNGNEVLEAKRILVTELSEDTTRNINLVKITKLTKTEITSSYLNNQEELAISVNSDTDYVLIKDLKASTLKLSSFEEDQIIYVFGSLVKEDFEARTIYLIEETETPSPTPTASPSVKETSTPEVTSEE
ncbi:hypothetical protein KJ570_03765 [Patescibacteria group bacterium]|nr:hypothetical protein [Patescibacteria group bacterium]MBU2036381.1 hypothetical protein [Patescibacteria group bacterium]